MATGKLGVWDPISIARLASYAACLRDRRRVVPEHFVVKELLFDD